MTAEATGVLTAATVAVVAAGELVAAARAVTGPVDAAAASDGVTAAADRGRAVAARDTAAVFTTVDAAGSAASLRVAVRAVSADAAAAIDGASAAADRDRAVAARDAAAVFTTVDAAGSVKSPRVAARAVTADAAAGDRLELAARPAGADESAPVGVLLAWRPPPAAVLTDAAPSVRPVESAAATPRVCGPSQAIPANVTVAASRTPVLSPDIATLPRPGTLQWQETNALTGRRSIQGRGVEALKDSLCSMVAVRWRNP